MGKNLSYVLFLLWLCYLITSSILLFTRGFLLTRVVQTNNSTCTLYKNIPCSEEQSSFLNVTINVEEQCSHDEKLSTVLSQIDSASKMCLPPKARVVLLVIDALRYDFTVYDETNIEPFYFQNKLKVIHRMLKESPDSSRLYKFVADPPTTTLQRLKGLTTGSLPTFIDAGSNFASSEINEDNIIDQLVSNNNSIVFMGDDTWNGLYPNRFVRNYLFPSFDVWDLDTVDNGVIQNLYPELNNTDWSLLIGHFLGVDHCGHYHGPNHPEMARKLNEMNDVIENVIEQLDDETVLFVIGDHGMTVRGDHGGDADDEVSAGMFVYSKRPLFSLGTQTESVKQVNLVPTLSVILGVPIPFQNLGTLIINCLPITNKTISIEEWQLTLYSMWSNVQQMMDYIRAYSQTTQTFNNEVLKGFFQSYFVFQSKVQVTDTEEKFVQLSKELQTYLDSLRTMCENLWVQYDSFAMARGLLFLFMSMFFVFVIVDGIPNYQLPEIFEGSFLLCSYVSLFLASGFATVLYVFKLVDDLLSTIFFATGLASQVMLVMLVVLNWELITLHWHDKSKIQRIPNLICRLVLLFNLFGLFSNSYIVEECFVLLFLLISIVLLTAASTNSIISGDRRKNENKYFKWWNLKFVLAIFAIAVLVRISMYFWCCREEQHWCFSSPHEINNITSKVLTTKLQWGITVVGLALLVIITKIWLRNCGNLNGFSLTVTFAKYMPTVIVVCVAGFWVLQRLPSKSKKNVNVQSPNVLAWVVYGLTSSGIVLTIWKPLCTYLLPKQGEFSVHSNSNVIPQIFKRIRGSLLLDRDRQKEDVPIVCGLGTVYSAVYTIIGIYLTLLFGLLLGDALAPSSVMMFLTAACVLIIMSLHRIEIADSVESLMDVPNTSILAWVILSQYFFYGTGHQPTLPNIQWEAAFVGTLGFSNNLHNIVPGTLIVLNTFCSHILMGFLLPLLIIAPFNLYVMLPSVVGKKKELQMLVQRGEVVLFEKDSLMITNAMSLACKYIMCHGIRVFASMLAATIHCRHLMIWKIFAPKFIFESIGMLVTLASVMIGFLVLLRVNRAVEHLIVTLNKLN